MGCDGAACLCEQYHAGAESGWCDLSNLLRSERHGVLSSGSEDDPGFIEHCIVEQKKPATIRRYVATIARAHMAAGLLSPCASEPVRLALKEMGRVASSRQRQALALGWVKIQEFPKTAGEDLRADRERTLLCVAYMTRWPDAASSSH
jgi:hypothetical protein